MVDHSSANPKVKAPNLCTGLFPTETYSGEENVVGVTGPDGNVSRPIIDVTPTPDTAH